MPHIETVNSIANSIADLAGVYGLCRHKGTTEECKHSQNNLKCCRPGFVEVMEYNIRQAVENEQKLAH